LRKKRLRPTLFVIRPFGVVHSIGPLPERCLNGDENTFMTEISRRNFLKLVGLASASTLGCSEPTLYRLPYINPPDSVIPGKASWFATTCRECPAGCGMLAKNRDGRVIKVEGNPEHPINEGKLCPRGQASLTRLYDPDRIKRPMRKTPKGDFVALSWTEAEEILAGEMGKTAGKGERLVFMTELITGPLRGLAEHWASSAGGVHALFEPFIYQPLKDSNRVVFGQDRLPTYRIEQADFLISFNAGFLETWLSNVEYARRFLAFREPRRSGQEGKSSFVFVGPRQSMTAVNADLRIRTAPGDEYLVALGIFLALLDLEKPGSRQPPDQPELRRLLDGRSLQSIASKTGVPEQDLRSVADRFVKSRRPIALAEGLTWFSPMGREAALAANLLNTWNGGTEELLDWERDSAQGDLIPAPDLKTLFDKMRSGGVDLFAFHNVNPAFSLPLSWDVRGALQAVKTKISFSSHMDETTALADFILPSHTPLESWGEYSPKRGVTGIMQPVMGHLLDTRHLGDILIRSGKKAIGQTRSRGRIFIRSCSSPGTCSGRNRAPAGHGSLSGPGSSRRAAAPATRPPKQPRNPGNVRRIFRPRPPRIEKRQGSSSTWSSTRPSSSTTAGWPTAPGSRSCLTPSRRRRGAGGSRSTWKRPRGSIWKRGPSWRSGPTTGRSAFRAFPSTRSTRGPLRCLSGRGIPSTAASHRVFPETRWPFSRRSRTGSLSS
jgi:anaerobic selenocysteine-containing dehydrogenase